MSNETKQEIVQLYKEGLSIRKIQEKLNLPYNAIYNVCVENNVIRKNISIRNMCDTKELIKLHKDGWSIRKLSIHFNIGEKKISAFLQEYYEKEKYLNEKYGEGKWRFMTREEIKNEWLAYKSFEEENMKEMIQNLGAQ